MLDAVVTVGSDLDLPGMLRRIVHSAVDLVDATYGALGVLDESRTRLAEFITVGIDQETRRAIGDLPQGHGILGLLIADAMPLLTQAVDETLRLYPPAWVGPRRSAVDFEFAGHRIPAGVPVNYSSWASHRLPEIFPDPDEFRPERFAPEERAKLPKGAYVPFGAGPRTAPRGRRARTGMARLRGDGPGSAL